jgi:hypothetical protein
LPRSGDFAESDPIYPTTPFKRIKEKLLSVTDANSACVTARTKCKSNPLCRLQLIKDAELKREGKEGKGKSNSLYTQAAYLPLAQTLMTAVVTDHWLKQVRILVLI